MERITDGLLLTREEAAAAAFLAFTGAEALRRRNGSVPAAVVLLVDALAEFGRRTPDAQVRSVTETANPGACGGRAGSAVIGVTVAAGQLDVSAQAVRRWCRRGDLIARRDAPGAPWIIDAPSAAALAARRAAGE